jgi:hypothetical protein
MYMFFTSPLFDIIKYVDLLYILIAYISFLVGNLMVIVDDGRMEILS